MATPLARANSNCPTERSIFSDNRGVSAIEFALIGPMFIGIFMAIAEFSMIFYCQNSAQNAARDTIRQLSINRITSSQAQTNVLSELPAWVVNSATVSVSQTSITDPTSNLIGIDVTFPASAAAPTGFFSSIYGSKIISAKATMVQEPPL